VKIEFVDSPVERTTLSRLKTGDTFFLCDDQDGDVNMFLRCVSTGPNDRYEFIILGEYADIVTDYDRDVQIVNTKLLVEI